MLTIQEEKLKKDMDYLKKITRYAAYNYEGLPASYISRKQHKRKEFLKWFNSEKYIHTISIKLIIDNLQNNSFFKDNGFLYGIDKETMMIDIMHSTVVHENWFINTDNTSKINGIVKHKGRALNCKQETY